MSDPIIASRDGVTVLKEVVTEGVPMPAVRYAIRVERDHPVAVRITETLPEGVSIDDIGFHQEYEKDCWRTDGGRNLAFERVIEPDEQPITVFFVRADAIESIEDSLEQSPSIEHVVPADEARQPAEVVFRGGSSAANASVSESATMSDSDLEEGVAGLSEDPSRLEVPITNGSIADEPGEPSESIDDSSTIDTDEDGMNDPPEPLMLNDPTGELSDTESPVLSTDTESPAAQSMQETESEPTSNDGSTETDAESAAGRLELNEAVETPEPTTAVSSTTATDPSPTTADEETIDVDLDSLEDRIETAIEERLSEVVDVAVTSAVEEALDDRLEADIGDLIDDRLEDSPAALDEVFADPDADFPVLDTVAAELDRTEDSDVLEQIIESAATESLPNHVQARIERVESEVNELGAYTDALRAFLDEHGTADQLLDEFDDRLTAVETETEERQSEVAELESTLETLADEIEAVDARLEVLDEVSEVVVETCQRIDDHDNAIDRLELDGNAVTERLEEAEDSMASLQADRDRIVETIRSAADELAATGEIDGEE